MITVDSLSKQFKLYRSPVDRLKELATGKKYHTDFLALNKVSFSVADGQTLGIVGQNGAGKSTLLKLLTGIILPDSGTVFIDGKITGLLELGTGFNAEMTGLANIFMNGTLLGMSREEIERKKEMIIEFAELGEFIYEQLKTYSSGMVMRLAFAVAIHADPKCFVVDEALSVGDAHFQQKCMNRIKEFRHGGGSIIFVSHDMNAIKVLCDRAILLDHGTVVEEGHPEAVVNKYNFIISKINDRDGEVPVKAREEDSYGTFEAKITNVSFVGDNSKSNIISSGERASISVDVEATTQLNDVNVGILIRDRFGQDIFGTNLYGYKQTMSLKKNARYSCEFKMNMNIGPGKYSISAALHIGNSHVDHCLHWKDNSASFQVAGNVGPEFIGVSKLYPEIIIHTNERVG